MLLVKYVVSKGETMRFLIQRVKEASVTVDNKVIGAVDKGFLVFVGICEGDNEQIADKLIKKTHRTADLYGQ